MHPPQYHNRSDRKIVNSYSRESQLVRKNGNSNHRIRSELKLKRSVSKSLVGMENGKVIELIGEARKLNQVGVETSSKEVNRSFLLSSGVDDMGLRNNGLSMAGAVNEERVEEVSKNGNFSTNSRIGFQDMDRYNGGYVSIGQDEYRKEDKFNFQQVPTTYLESGHIELNSSKGQDSRGDTMMRTEDDNNQEKSQVKIHGMVAKPWKEIIKPKGNKARLKFEYHCPEVVEGRVVIRPPLSVDLQGRKAWENCLVGYFFEKRVSFHSMEFNAKKRWGNRGLKEVIMNDEGFFFFKFEEEEDLLEVLEDEACMIEVKPLILQRWYPQIVLAKDVPKTIPLWVKMYNIPLQYWHVGGLSRIGSGIGNILLADGLTERMCKEATGRLSFAKLLIEVDANKPLPDQVFVVIPKEEDRDEMEVRVRLEYPWRPSWCPTCSIFGHSVHICPISNAGHEKKGRDELVGKSATQEMGGFVEVHRKGKNKVGQFYSNQKQGIPFQGNRNFVHNKKKQSSFSYINRGKPVSDLNHGSVKKVYKGENSGVNKGVENDDGGILNSNRFGVLARGNMLDSLEVLTKKVEIRPPPVFEDKKKLNIEVNKGGVEGGNKYSDRDVGFSLNKPDVNPNWMGSNVSNRSEGKSDFLNKGMDLCVLNSEAEVESDQEQSARFMVEDNSFNRSQGSDSEVGGDAEDQEHDAFAIEQIFGDNNGGVKKVGTDIYISQ